MKHRSVAAIRVAAGCLLLSACGDEVRPSVDGAELVVGPEGGVLVFSGGQLAVPAGALPRPTPLSAQAQPSGWIRFGPSGLRFERPARLGLDAAPGGEDDIIVKVHEGVVVEGADAAETFFEPFSTTLVDGRLEADIRGFSSYSSRGATGGGVDWSGNQRVGELTATWNACNRTVELEWTGDREVVLERIVSRDQPRERIVRRRLLPGARDTRPTRTLDRGLPAPGPGEDEFTITYEAYDTTRGIERWARFLISVTVAATEITAPGSVQDLRAARPTTTEIQLDWRPPAGPAVAATGYVVTRNPPFPGDTVRETTAATFTDVAATPAVAYSYGVQSFTDFPQCGTRRLGSRVTTSVTPVGSSGLAVANLGARVRGRAVTLSWDPASNVARWQIRRGEVGQPLASIGEVQTPGLVDVVTPGRFVYEVTPIAADGSLGVSATVEAEVLDCSLVDDPALRLSYRGRPLMQYEIELVLEAPGDPNPMVEMSMDVVTAGTASFLWEIELTEGWIELGRSRTITAPATCPVGGYCRIRATASDACGDRSTVLMLRRRS